MYAATTKDLPVGRRNAADGRFSASCQDATHALKEAP
jgi:hypothetical protein